MSSVIPCHRGAKCSWPACAFDCDGRPGMAKLGIFGVGRISDNDKAILLILSRPITDDELRYLHEVLKRAVACIPDDLG